MLQLEGQGQAAGVWGSGYAAKGPAMPTTVPTAENCAAPMSVA